MCPKRTTRGLSQGFLVESVFRVRLSLKELGHGRSVIPLGRWISGRFQSLGLSCRFGVMRILVGAECSTGFTI